MHKNLFWFLGSVCCCCSFWCYSFCGDDFIVAVAVAAVAHFECADFVVLGAGLDVVAVHASFVDFVSSFSEIDVVAVVDQRQLGYFFIFHYRILIEFLLGIWWFHSFGIVHFVKS